MALTQFSSTKSLTHSSRVISAEVMMAQFIAMHALQFLAADHLPSLFSTMFPDSRIVTDFFCRHMMTKAIICDTLDPIFKKLFLESLALSPFNLFCYELNVRGDSM